MDDFGKYCKNRIKFGFFRFIFLLLIAILVFFLSSKFNLFSSRVYALENTTIYGSNTGGNLGNNGYLNYWKENGGLFSTQLNTVNADTSWGIYFFINKASTVGKVYKVRLNFNDYDFLKSVNASYIQVIGYNGTENVGICNVLSFSLLNQGGSNNQAKGVEFTYNCLEPSNYKYIGIIKYDDNNNRLRTTTISWRLNNVQWEEVEDTEAQQIIMNQTQNTNTIVNNQNENTQNIINNQNEIAEQQHQEQLSCDIIDKNNITTDNKAMNTSGTLIDNNNYGITDYININNAEVKILTIYNYNYSGSSICYYDVNKSLISCQNQSNLSTLTIPNNAYYLRSTIYKSESKPTLQVCKNGNQAISDDINELKETLTDTNVDTSSLNNVVGWLPPGPVDSIITLPLTLFNSILSALNVTCNPVTLPLPFINQNLVLPCPGELLNQINGFSIWWTSFGLIIAGIILYNYLLNLYNWVDKTLSMRENTMPGYYEDNWGGGA